MTWESLIAFNVVLLAAIASPGAALLYFIKTSVASGRATGIAVGVGLGTAAAGSMDGAGPNRSNLPARKAPRTADSHMLMNRGRCCRLWSSQRR